MWDTSKDYRLKVAEKSIENFIRVIEGSNLRGFWNKKKVRLIAKYMKSRYTNIILFIYFTSRTCKNSPNN